jgi:hypothetical protein
MCAEFSPIVTVDGTPETAAGPVNTNELILFAGTSTDNVSVAVKVEVTVLLDVLPPDDPWQPASDEMMTSISAISANLTGRIVIPSFL